mmetsp:Transcript_106809/g.130263  ORF Transcript_106809/g.130263 Transcript_106809/m.130263 type:complete len:82 (-) Transcript_106809:253-498(-)
MLFRKTLCAATAVELRGLELPLLRAEGPGWVGIDHSVVGTCGWSLGFASKDMVELFALTTVDIGLATLWWKLHLPAAVLVV